jgi:hypothetical protein
LAYAHLFLRQNIYSSLEFQARKKKKKTKFNSNCCWQAASNLLPPTIHVYIKGVVVEAVVSEVMTRRKEEDGPPYLFYHVFHP